MRDHNHTEDMSHNCPPSRRHNTYHKEMDHAFTLIFHNIKRLQDDRLCNSTPDMTQSQDDQRESIKPAMSLTVPSLQRTRCKSDPLLKSTEDEIEKRAEFLDGRVKSRSFCGTEASPLQRRKVRFADDYEMKDRRIDRQRPVLTTRPWSNLQPLIVVTKES